MLKKTELVENGIIAKLNCMYLVSRNISLPTIDILQRKMRTQDNYLEETTARINELIHSYF